METQKTLNSQINPEKEKQSWKNQHCENDYSTQSNLQIQCNPYQLSLAFFTELEQKILQFVWKHKDPELPKQS